MISKNKKKAQMLDDKYVTSNNFCDCYYYQRRIKIIKSTMISNVLMILNALPGNFKSSYSCFMFKAEDMGIHFLVWNKPSVDEFYRIR